MRFTVYTHVPVVQPRTHSIVDNVGKAAFLKQRELLRCSGNLRHACPLAPSETLATNAISTKNSSEPDDPVVSKNHGLYRGAEAHWLRKLTGCLRSCLDLVSHVSCTVGLTRPSSFGCVAIRKIWKRRLHIFILQNLRESDYSRHF
jgi:hypothetical protein